MSVLPDYWMMKEAKCTSMTPRSSFSDPGAAAPAKAARARATSSAASLALRRGKFFRRLRCQYQQDPAAQKGHLRLDRVADIGAGHFKGEADLQVVVTARIGEVDRERLQRREHRKALFLHRFLGLGMAGVGIFARDDEVDTGPATNCQNQ